MPNLRAISTDSSLLLYHKINEGSGTSINDSSGNSIDGNLNWEHFVNKVRVVQTIEENKPDLEEIFGNYWGETSVSYTHLTLPTKRIV